MTNLRCTLKPQEDTDMEDLQIPSTRDEMKLSVIKYKDTT